MFDRWFSSKPERGTVEWLKVLLEKQRKDLIKHILAHVTWLEQNSQRPSESDPCDNAQTQMEFDTAAGNQKTRIANLASIDKKLAQIELLGSASLACILCGRPIETGRLEVVPTTERCAGCANGSKK